MIHFSDFIGNLSEEEIDNCMIILDGYQMEIANEIEKNNEMEKYGIIKIKYIEEKDCAILYFDPIIFQDMIEEYHQNYDD